MRRSRRHPLRNDALRPSGSRKRGMMTKSQKWTREGGAGQTRRAEAPALVLALAPVPALAPAPATRTTQKSAGPWGPQQPQPLRQPPQELHGETEATKPAFGGIRAAQLLPATPAMPRGLGDTPSSTRHQRQPRPPQRRLRRRFRHRHWHSEIPRAAKGRNPSRSRRRRREVPRHGCAGGRCRRRRCCCGRGRVSQRWTGQDQRCQLLKSGNCFRTSIFFRQKLWVRVNSETDDNERVTENGTASKRTLTMGFVPTVCRKLLLSG